MRMPSKVSTFCAALCISWIVVCFAELHDGQKANSFENGLNRDRSVDKLKKTSKSAASHSQTWASQYEAAWKHIQSMAEQNVSFATLLDTHFHRYNHPIKGADKQAAAVFNCDLPPSANNPDTAHAVRPGDIKVVSAIGDSITAGYGITATNILQILRNDRQESWCSGGIRSLEEGVITTPNILRKFSSRVSGFSWDESKAGDLEAGLNAAVAGAVAEEMLEQAVHLTNLMYKEGPKMGVDWENDWKLVNFLIGGNDLCSYCDDTEAYSPDTYALNVQRAIDHLYNNGPPKVIVTVNTIFDITALPAFSDGIVCDVIQWFVCGCATSSSNHGLLQFAQREYHARLEALVASGRWDRPERPDFTVIMLPHLQYALPPKTESGEVDQSYWGIDCFHPGRKAHQVLAVSLWNQMFAAEGSRGRDVDWTVSTGDIYCPSEEDPFIKTRLNSGPLAKDVAGNGGENIAFGDVPLPQRTRSLADHDPSADTEKPSPAKSTFPLLGRARALWRSSPEGPHALAVHAQAPEGAGQGGGASVGVVVGATLAGVVVLAGLIMAGLGLALMTRKRRRDDEQPLEMQ